MSRAFFFAHLTAWGIIWGHVMLYYAAFARREWRAGGGRWRDVPANMLCLLGFTFKPLLADVYSFLRYRRLPADPQRYRWTKAHRMGFFIAMAAVTYTIMGLTLAINPDRTQWSQTEQLWTSLLIVFTQLAGLGHLFTALEHNPRRWRWFVAAILVYYPVAMVLFNAFYFG